MIQSQGIEKYRNTNIETTSQAGLIVMLYDGAIKFLRLALVSVEQGNLQSTNNYLIRAQDIMAELAGSLNLEAGQIAENLLLLYDFSYRRLVDANLSKSVAPINEVIELLTSLRGAWAEVASQAKSQPGQAWPQNVQAGA